MARATMDAEAPIAASWADTGGSAGAHNGTRTGLVAREAESEAIEVLLGSVPPAAALVLEGPPGVGKTSLLDHGVASARERGFRVLVARGSGAEAEFPFAGLIDLFDGVTSEQLASIPAPQLRALEVALYRAEPTGAPPEPQVISLAVLSALRALAAAGPVVVAVDDLQWLDLGSGEALVYAAKRLVAEPVVFLLARRPGRRPDVERAIPIERLAHVAVGTLSLGATRQLLATRLGLRLPHHVLRRVYDVTAGNPLFALEVGRSLVRRGPQSVPEQSFGDEIPLPDEVEDLLGLRVADLDDDVRRVLLALALGADVRVTQLRELAGPELLDRAIEAGVVAVDGEKVRASHPLLAEVAVRRASDEEKRGLHRRLAELVADEELAALHLALATEEPDEELAARIESAAEQAAARGATRLGVDLASHAWRLTPPDVPAYDRLLTVSRHLHDAGEKQRLTDLLGPRVASLPAGGSRVLGYHLLTGGVVNGNAEITALHAKALEEAGDIQPCRGRAQSFLAENVAVIQVRDIAESDRLAAEAVADSEDGDAEDQRLALYTRSWTQALRGQPVDHLVERFEELAGHRGYLARYPQRVAGQRRVWRGEIEQGRAFLEAFMERTELWGEPSPHALARLHLVELELRAGDWPAVERLMIEWAASTDDDLLHWPMYERCRALLAMGRGDVEDALLWGGRADSQAEEQGVGWDRLEASRALGVTALLAKDPEEAARRLTTVWEHNQREGVLDPGAFPVAPDLVEALLELGSYDAASAVVAQLAELAEDQDHPWARVGAQRSAALVAIHADGYADEHAAALVEAAAAYQALGLCFDEARTLLALGRAQRRAKKWGAARDTLERAAAAFERLGSPGWVADVRAELERSGARRPAAEGGLTPTERRVADLAVEGLANKQIARTLVVTVNTVEFHLRNTYAKLGIRGRPQLAAALQELDGA
ncbi:AAA family ATPase [Nocardioides bigeumensis]|uniref:LuxR family transcriptional regulator n=1 Tax=Nocardioides bigeumensis TaxID=433657 RepID=A0ABN2YTS7_9ACTN